MVTEDARQAPDAEAAKALSLWYIGQNSCALRSSALARPKDDECLVRTLCSGVSRGTERLIAGGSVPASEYVRMRGPGQEGDFPFPVKYGYQCVGIVEAGPAALRGKRVFALHPHQSRFVTPVSMTATIPDSIPAPRATLAANMETALNAIWDSGAKSGQSIAVIGGGIVGLLVATLAVRLLNTPVRLIDIVPERRALAELFGARFALPDEAGEEADIVFHTSASEAGLAKALDIAAFEGTIVEMSWYGDRPVCVPLGGAFHSRRLRLVASQVGHVAPSHRDRYTHAQRLALAVSMLDDARLDALIGHEIPFEQAPARLPALLTDARDALGIVLHYP